jgi:hypothetical protein
VVATAVNLEVGTTGKGSANAQYKISRPGGGDRDVLDTEVFLAAENGGSHGAANGLGANGLICG